LAGNPKFVDISYESIATVTVSTATPTVEFTSIPATFKHLQLRIFTNNSLAAYYMQMQFNSSTTDYNWHGFYGGGNGASQITSIYNTSPSACIVGVNSTAALSSGQIMCAAVIDILDYGNTNKYKVSRSLYGYNSNTTDNGQQHIGMFSGEWRNTNAITSIKFLSDDGNFIVGSHYALYGIKG
jgi:hypothetical protein